MTQWGMCLIGVAWKTHPKFGLVMAANRDEFHNRPSARAEAWKGHPQIFGGRDLKQHGSWLAVSTTGRMAAVTNVRRMATPAVGSPSRGQLVADFLQGTSSAAEYAASLAEAAENYSGFNLLLYDGTELHYVDNHPEYQTAIVEPGVHVLSNARLDTPWPKSQHLRGAMESWVADNWESPAPLLKALSDRTLAPETDLPHTGVSREMEKMLSASFIAGPHYGTRCSTVVTITAERIEFVEKRFDPNGVASGETVESLSIS